MNLLSRSLGTFFESDLKFAAEGRALPGRLLRMEPRRRVPRDKVKG